MFYIFRYAVSYSDQRRLTVVFIIMVFCIKMRILAIFVPSNGGCTPDPSQPRAEPSHRRKCQRPLCTLLCAPKILCTLLSAPKTLCILLCAPNKTVYCTQHLWHTHFAPCLFVHCAMCNKHLCTRHKIHIMTLVCHKFKAVTDEHHSFCRAASYLRCCREASCIYFGQASYHSSCRAAAAQ